MPVLQCLDAVGVRSRRVDRPISDRAACPPERRSRRPTSNLRSCRCCHAKARSGAAPVASIDRSFLRSRQCFLSCSLQLYLYDMGTTLALGSLVCSQLACSARFAPPRLPALSDRWPATPSSDGRMHWPGSHASLARAPRLPPAYPHGYGMARLALTGMGLAPLGALWHFAMASSRLAH